LLVPTFAFLFVLVRGVPVLLYRCAMTPAQRLPFVLQQGPGPEPASGTKGSITPG